MDFITKNKWDELLDTFNRIRLTVIDEYTLEIYRYKKGQVLLVIIAALVLLLYLLYSFKPLPDFFELPFNRHWILIGVFIFVAVFFVKNIWGVVKEKEILLKKQGTKLLVNDDIFESLDYLSYISIQLFTDIKIFTSYSISVVSKDGKELELVAGLSKYKAVAFTKKLKAFLDLKVINETKVVKDTRPFDAL